MKTCKRKAFLEYLQIQAPHLEIENLNLIEEAKWLRSILTADMIVKFQLKYPYFLGPTKQ